MIELIYSPARDGKRYLLKICRFISGHSKIDENLYNYLEKNVKYNYLTFPVKYRVMQS